MIEMLNWKESKCEHDFEDTVKQVSRDGTYHKTTCRKCGRVLEWID